MQPKLSKPVGKPMPKEVMTAASKADASVGADVASKVMPMLGDYSPAQKKALVTAASKLVSKITGQALKPTGTDTDMQYLALAIAALNTYRGTTGQAQLDLENLDAMMLISVIEEAMVDTEFLDYINEQLDSEDAMTEGEEEMGEEMEDMGEEMDMGMDADKKRRAMLKGAM